MRLHFLDGMRGWAALAVVIWHYFITIFPATPATADALRYIPFINGPFAVSIFFLISGFALSIATVERPDQWRLLRMAASRYFRLVIPIFAICLLIYAALLADLIYRPLPAPIASHLQFPPSLAGLLQFSFFDIFFRYDSHHTYLTPLWTMQFEFFGSMIVFLLLFTLQRWRWCVAVYAASLFFYFPNASLYGLFVTGVLLANLFARIERLHLKNWMYLPILAAIAFGASAPYLTDNSIQPIGLSGIACLFTALITLPSARAFFSNRFSQFLGKISFPLYLVHLPLVYVFSARLHAHLQPTLGNAESALITTSISLPLALFAAWLFLPVERFSITASRQLGKVIAATGKNLYGLAHRPRTRAS